MVDFKKALASIQAAKKAAEANYDDKSTLAIGEKEQRIIDFKYGFLAGVQYARQLSRIAAKEKK
jgi:hypothetical protein